ncbi:thermonuclease family protein [Phyllobacterium sp. K27]
MRNFIAFLVLFTATPALGETYAGGRLTIIDGDTIALPCDPASGYKRGCAEKIRLLGIDAPETSKPSCEKELTTGLAAKERLRELLEKETISIERSGRKDQYRRSLASLKFEDGSDIGSLLIAENLALPYRSGAAAKLNRTQHWCAPGIIFR